MNALIIDDQKNVVNGMKKGICWDRLHIENAFTAYNAMEAKTIIQKEHVDIMLCDIEMPGENGLELFRWAREYDDNIECIFLTAYADFEFAREAVKLGGFDYILQPAPYEEIEEAILRVIRKIHDRTELKKYSAYGERIYENRDILIEGVLKNWFEGMKTDVQEGLKTLQEFQIHLTENAKVCGCLLDMFQWADKGQQMENGLLKYAFVNILTELLSEERIEVLGACLDNNNYGFVFFQPEGKEIPDGIVKQGLEQFMTVCREFYGGTGAGYLGNFCRMTEFSHEIEKIREARRDNVGSRSGIFVVQGYTEQQNSSMEWMKNWDMKLTGKKSEEVKEEALAFLDTELNGKVLKQFYMEFMQNVATACDRLGISNYQIFKERESFERSLEAYRSVEEMKKLVVEVTDYFSGENQEEDDYIESVIQYIHCNLEKDIRRSEIAQDIGLNEDYLSRIFKKKKDISLKEYIILEKMRTAQTLLKNTEFPISMIASKVGFSNFSHFSQTYKKIMGRTPAQERI